MARESQTREAATAATAQAVKPASVALGFWGTAKGFGLLLWHKISKQLAIWWALVCKYVAEPVTIAAVSAYAVVEKIYRNKRTAIMCRGHAIVEKIERIKARRVTAALMMTVLTIIVFSTSFYSLGLEVIMDGKSVGYVMNEAEYKDSVARVGGRVTDIMGRPYSVNPNVSFSYGVVENNKLIKPNELDAKLFAQVDDIQELYTVEVDGEVVGACRDKASIDAVLKELKASTNPNVRKEFSKKVDITHKAVDAKYLMSAQEMKTLLKSERVKQVPYTMNAGESVDVVAAQYGMQTADLLAINPGLNAYDSTENQEIFVTRATPFLPVKTIQRVSEMRPIAYKVTEVKDPTQYVGKSTTKVMGVAGKESVVEEITYENGAVRSRKKLSSKVMQAPVTQIVLVGTKPAPVRVATGVFRRPTGDCVISSNYGYRRSEFHTGVDFALPSGSAVVAADGGTIAYAGWKGDYGNLVIISHGNGLQTYYGHNSRLTVTTGQQIAKGEQIAEIGSTGRSTGPHCHFEIRQDGRHVNPWRYIS